MATTWDDAFEAAPAGTANASTGATSITELKTAISEREDTEHNFKVGAKPFHKAGKCSVMYKGTSAAIDLLTNLTGTSEGCLAWSSDDFVIKVFRGATNTWETISIDHSALAGLDDALHTIDDHTQYLKLNKISQNIAQDLLVDAGVKIDSVDLSEDYIIVDIIDTYLSTEGFAARDAGAPYEENIVYGPETTDSLISAYIVDTNYDENVLEGLIGPTSPPDISIVASGTSAMVGWGENTTTAICFPVPRGYYWMVTSIEAGVTIDKMEVV